MVRPSINYWIKKLDVYKSLDRLTENVCHIDESINGLFLQTQIDRLKSETLLCKLLYGDIL